MQQIKLSELVEQIQDTIQEEFGGEAYWVSAQIMNVKKIEASQRCYLTLNEYEKGIKIAEVRAVFWNSYYNEIEKFEKLTKQPFKDGIEILCKVKIRFHKVYGLNFDIIEIDSVHTVGTLELEKQRTLERLQKENPSIIQLVQGVYKTYNKNLPIPEVIEKIALITAPNSDGQRDFLQELKQNKHLYTFSTEQFLTTVQGENAHQSIIAQLKLIEQKKEQFDIVAIVRGGGSQTDFKPFDDYELSKYVAGFPIPIYTGIGHDRNQSIVDLMAREQKVPAKVASIIVENNFEFENKLIEIKTHFYELVDEQIQIANDDFGNIKRIVKLSSPQAIINRGFAIITCDNKIIIDPKKIKENSSIETILKDEIIHSIVTKKTTNENQLDI